MSKVKLWLHGNRTQQFYEISKKDYLLIWLKGLIIIGIFAYFFYRSAIAMIVLLPIIPGYFKTAKEELRDKMKDDLLYQFKELIEIVAGNLRAGYSVENAFLETGKEMSRQHPLNAPVNNVFTLVKKGLENNVPLDERLKDIGRLSGIKEMIEFSEVFTVAKQSGGNMIDLIGQFAGMISDKIDTEKEIKVLLSARRGEQKIMNIVPFAILFYLDITSPGFFSSLYHNVMGVIIMTICMFIYVVAYGLSQKMLQIEI